MFRKYILPLIITALFITLFFTIDYWKEPVMLILTSTRYIIILCIIALLFAVIAFIYSKLAYKVDNDPTLEHADQDRASFKKYSEMNIAIVISFYFALGSILLISINNAPMYLGIISLITLVIAMLMRYYGYSMINKLYPEKDLPENFEADFDDKLIDSLTKDEMYTIFNGLYNAFKMTNILMPAAMMLITIYGFATGIPQHFALTIIAAAAIIINIVYQVTVRRMI